MARKFEEIFDSLPKKRQKKIRKRTEKLLKEYWENAGGVPSDDSNYDNNKPYEEWFQEKIEKHYGDHTPEELPDKNK